MKIRAFIALELDERVRARIAETMAALRPSLPGVRWVSPEGVHLTLRFLGPARPDQLEQLGPLLAEAARSCPPLSGRISGAGMFPERGAPRVLWIGLATGPELIPLQAACERAARAAGFDPEHRAFRPHLTLGRWRDRAERPPLPSLDLGDADIQRLVLFRSELRPGGARYTPLAAYMLGVRPDQEQGTDC